jgi:CRP-like cAMP-binding protein
VVCALSLRLYRPREEKAMKTEKSAPVKASLDVLAFNAILIGLDGPEVAALIAGSSLVDLPVRHPIYRPGEQIADVYFPIDCVLSVVSRMKDGAQIEIGTIGREGVSAIPLILGATTSANECYCQVPGSAVKIDAALFQSLRSTRFRQLLDRYVQAYVNMLGQLAACNRLHTVYERCARWLLMTQDRVESDEIPLTHEYLAMMLGTQRSGVTIAAGTLQNAGFIRYGHGVITILDRLGLEQASCECYEVAREQFGGFLQSVKGLAAMRKATSDGAASQKRKWQ